MKTAPQGVYQCLVAARERGRDWLETGIYAAFLASALFAITQFVMTDRATARTGKLSAHHHGHKTHMALQHLKAV